MNAQPDRRDRNLRRRVLPRRLLLACALALAVCSPAQADSVTDWNIVAGAVAPRMTGLQREGSLLADPRPAAANARADDGAYRHPRCTQLPSTRVTRPTCRARQRAPAHPPDAAVAAAAYNVLLAWIPGDAPLTLPSGVTTLDTVYANALSALPDAGKADWHRGRRWRRPRRSCNSEPATVRPGSTRSTRQRRGRASTSRRPAPEFPAQIIPSFAAWAGGDAVCHPQRLAIPFRPGRDLRPRRRGLHPRIQRGDERRRCARARRARRTPRKATSRAIVARPVARTGTPTRASSSPAWASTDGSTRACSR